MTTAARVAEIVSKLNEAIDLLTENTPDMDVTEWNATPEGQAVRRISDAIEMIASLPADEA